MQPIAWVFSDLHVRNHDRIWVNRHDLVGDTAFALEQAAALVVDQPVTVLLAGDNFEAKLQRADAIAMMRTFIDTIADEAKQELWFIDGQHDLSVPPLMKALHWWPEHLHKQTLNINGVNIYGLDYCPVDTAAIELKAIPAGTDVLLTHQVWKEIMGEKFGVASLYDVANAKLVISGDYHHEKFMTIDTQRGPLGFLSPGPLCTQDISEVAEHCGFLLMDDLSIRRVPIKSRKYTEIMLSSDDQLEQFLATDPESFYDRDLPPTIQKGMLRVRYPQNKPDYFARVARVFGAHVHLFEKSQTVTSGAATAIEEERRTRVLSDAPLEATIAEHYSDNPVAAEIAVRIAKAPNKDEECQRIFDELMQGQRNDQSVAAR